MIDLKTMTAEEKQRLSAELRAERRAEKDRIAKDREAYEEIKDEAIRGMFTRLQAVSEDLLAAKERVFSEFGRIRDMKDDLFKTKSGRNSDTYTTRDSTVTIKLGSRMYEGWADEVEVGIRKVRDYLKTLARNEEMADLVEVVMDLLARDRKGNLKANKVLELEKLAVKSGNEEFLDGLAIIKNAYRPAPSCKFVEVSYRDINGREHSLPLSMSAIDN